MAHRYTVQRRAISAAKRSMAEMNGQSSIAEDDARDPQRTSRRRCAIFFPREKLYGLAENLAVNCGYAGC